MLFGCPELHSTEPGAVAAQGHIDMVTEKDADVAHDFFTDSIKLQRKGDWLQVVKGFAWSAYRTMAC